MKREHGIQTKSQSLRSRIFIWQRIIGKIKGDALMKFGIRKPSLKGRISARTSIKRQIVHRAGLKMPRGFGWVRDPKKYAYNKVYNRTSFDIFKLIKKLFK
jgi:hypothetical protein